MKTQTLAAAVLATLFAAPPLRAADLEAGKAKAQTVCAACHGANGVSVSDSIPNLAGQRLAYLESQLKAWKDGSRKNPIMNAIGAQLSSDDIGNVAAFFSSLPAVASSAKSEFLPALARAPLVFPADYRASYTHYQTINFPATRQVRRYLANPVAVKAAREGKPLPDGAYMLVEVYSAKLGADKQPIVGPDGFFVPDQLTAYTAMAREPGWGQPVPEMLRNENWNYALFSAGGQLRTNFNQAECLACHKPLDKVSYLFTMERLAHVAQAR